MFRPDFSTSNYVTAAIFLLAMLAWSHAGAGPRWIEHVSMPESVKPAAGQSRFDQLFMQHEHHYLIPYPFDKLIDSLESRLDNGGQAAVRRVLIPMGRSLQRDAPAPDYFRYPRVVIALEGEPVTSGDVAGQVLEYRLFIAHQPKTETLEIISYNDLAGRFEFQVVERYAVEKSPRVKPANRVMCLSCHQNAGPIFAKRPWSETSFNVEVAKQMVKALPQQYNSQIDIVTADAGIIDVLVEKANYLSLAQLIWKQGCISRACRISVLRAILQYRLSAESNFERSHRSYQRDYVAELNRNWRENWPRGLALASSRIIDRNPFAPETSIIEQDPLIARPPHATWYRPDSILATGIIYRLAGFFTLADIQHIDRHLIANSDTRSIPSHKYSASCKLQTDTPVVGILSCGDSDISESLRASFEIDLQQGEPISVRVLQLQIPGDSNLLQPGTVHSSRFQGGIRLELGSNDNALSQRLANGDRVKALILRWEDSLLRGDASLEVEISAEFQLIEKALTEMRNNQYGGGESFNHNRFRRQPILTELMQALGMLAPAQPQRHAGLPQETIPTSARLAGDLALLEPYCGHCHSDDSVNPPGFLAGKELQDIILQCAPRMLARLQAWQPGSEFTRSPMPPPATLEISGTSVAKWPRSDHYQRLVAALEKLLATSVDSGVNKRWNSTSYLDLPPCLGAS